MRKLAVTECMTRVGVYDAKGFDQWYNAYHSDERAAEITRNIMGADAFLLGRTTYEMLGRIGRR